MDACRGLYRAKSEYDTLGKGVTMINLQENNEVRVAGTVKEEPEYSHELFGEKFYTLKMDVKRLSDVSDEVFITVSERLCNIEELTEGAFIYVKGQFRSYNNYYSDDRKLILTVFAKELHIIENEKEIDNPNFIYLNGFICKEPQYRKTPLEREITDILIAVNRLYNKSDYIPCIAWGRNARFASNLKVGQNVKIWGRIQSREYQKRIDEETAITKIAYEVSVSKIELATEEISDSEIS